MHHARSDGTRVVDRVRHFQPRLHDVNDLMRQLSDRRIEGPTLAVALMDASGVRLRLWAGSGPQVFSVGRHAGCDLQLQQDDASLRHAIVVADDDGVRVLDLSSLCGVSGRAEAPPGRWALVRVGDSVLAAALLDGGVDTGADPSGDAFELRRLCRLLEAPAVPGPRGLPGNHLPLPVLSRTPSVAAPTPLPGPQSRRGRTGGHPVVRLDDVTGLCLLGRSERCHLQVDDGGVSRLHAALVAVRSGGQRQMMLVDVGSTNGTMLLQIDAGAIHERHLGPAGRGHIVHAGDMVELGERVRVRLVGAAHDDGADDCADDGADDGADQAGERAGGH